MYKDSICYGALNIRPAYALNNLFPEQSPLPENAIPAYRGPGPQMQLMEQFQSLVLLAEWLRKKCITRRPFFNKYLEDSNAIKKV
jgi:hypothetical protein